MRTLLLLGVLLLCGIGAAEAAPPEIGTAIMAERVVLRLEPGEVVKARSVHGFKVSDRIGVAAYADGDQWTGHELAVASTRPLTLAGRGAYVEVRTPRASPLSIKAVALRKMRLVVYMEWTA